MMRRIRIRSGRHNQISIQGVGRERERLQEEREASSLDVDEQKRAQLCVSGNAAKLSGLCVVLVGETQGEVGFSMWE